METPEQYTVKTPEEILQKHYVLDKGLNNPEYVINAMREYSSELIKENERLREENKLYREALTEAKEVLQWHLDNSAPCHAIYHSDFFNLTANAITQADEALSKFQPKKDESTSKG